MKKLKVTFDGTKDATGYLFSFAKCLSAALRCGGYEEYADDIVASSGFAFRMWVAPDLCPSATSIWEFKCQRPWVESGGLTCDYVERLWGQDDMEAERRLAAIGIIKESIDRGTAAVAWDISGCEWGLVIGYDDGTQTLFTLKINGAEAEVPYDSLGRLDLPILSVLTVTGKTDKSDAGIVADTKKFARAHLLGNEWCDNAKGLAAYDSLIEIVEKNLRANLAWNLEYYLGTYAALKYYAWKFFEKYSEGTLADIYARVHECWMRAFDAAKAHAGDIAEDAPRAAISGILREAKSLEESAVLIFEK